MKHDLSDAAVKARRARLVEMVEQKCTQAEICAETGFTRGGVYSALRSMGMNPRFGPPVPRVSRNETDERNARIRRMAAEGNSSKQIASALKLTQDQIAHIVKRQHIEVRADAIVGRIRHHDPKRILENMVMDAEHLTSDVGLIDFSRLTDPDEYGRWIKSLRTSYRELRKLIARLRKEQIKYEHETRGEHPHAMAIQGTPRADQSDADASRPPNATAAQEIVCGGTRNPYGFE